MSVEDVLGLDIDVTATEKSVGQCQVDILAQIGDDERTVVVKNQLEQLDHDYLGRPTAYAAGVDAAIIIWITPRFKDE